MKGDFLSLSHLFLGRIPGATLACMEYTNDVSTHILVLISVLLTICKRKRTSVTERISPDCPLSTDVLLQNDGCRSRAEERPPPAPPSEVFLDGDTGSPEPVQAQLLQIRHLTRAEKDLCAPKLVLVGVL